MKRTAKQDVEIINNSGLRFPFPDWYKYLGRWRNNRRGRVVYMYDHPTDETQVLTVGRPQQAGSPVVVCSEPRSSYSRQLSGDWSDYD
jgi:hypothetical protein